MNPANFQSMSAQGMPPQANQQPAVRQGNGFSGVQQRIMQVLSQQSAPPGWQSSVPLQQRCHTIFQLFSSLRLLKTDTSPQQALQLALKFEVNNFMECRDKNSYDEMCNGKLNEIRNHRAKQSAEMQQQMNMPMNMPPQMQNMTQNFPQNQGQGNVQHGMPNAQQQHMMMQGLSMPQQPQRPLHQMHDMAMMTNHPMPMSQAQGHPPQRMAPHPNQFIPTQEEVQQINRMAEQHYQNTPPERIEVLRNDLNRLTPQQKEQLSRQGPDPLLGYFRREAMKRFADMKRTAAGGMGGPNVQAAAMMNGMPRPMSQNAGPPVSTPQQSFEPPFDQIFGQHQDGLRSEQAGQDVVPASNSQVNFGQRNAPRANGQQQTNIQAGANRGLQNPNLNNPQQQALWNAQRNVNFSNGMGTNNPAGNFPHPNQAPSDVLQGQPGGLDNQITRTLSQTPGMPNLNKAAVPPGQAPNMWQQRNPQSAESGPQGHPMTPQPQQQVQPTSQTRPMSLQDMQLRQHLQSLPEDGRQRFIQEMQRRQIQQRQRQAQMQHMAAQQQQQHQQGGNVMTGGVAMNETFPPSGRLSQQGPQGRPPGPMPNPNMPSNQHMMMNANGQPISAQQQAPGFGGPMRQPAVTGQRGPQQRGVSQMPGNAPNVPLTDDQARQMDQQPYPTQMLSRESQLSQMPKEVKTWGQLKAFAAQNEHTLPVGTLAKLKELQAIHYRSQFQDSRLQQGAVNPGPGQPQAPFAQMVSQPNTQGQVTASQLPNTRNMPQFTASPQEIQMMRAKLPPGMTGVSEEQVRDFIINHKQENWVRNMRAHQAQNAQMANMANMVPAGGSGTPQMPPSVQGKDTTQQAQKVSEPTAGPGTKQGPAKNSTPAAKQAPKGTKRPTQEDIVEVPNPNLSNAQAKAQGQKQAPPTKQQPSSQTQDKKGVNSSKDASKAPKQPQAEESQASRPPGMPDLPKEVIQQRDAQLIELMQKVAQSTGPRKVVSLAPPIKAQLTQKLKEYGVMVGRMELSFPTFFRNNPDVERTTKLIQVRNHLKAQYKDGDWNVKDQLTITPKEFDDYIMQIREYFAFVMYKFVKRKPGENGEQQQAQSQAQQAAPTQDKAPLNAANLREHQMAVQAQRAASMQRHQSNHGNRVPAAPTSEKAPPFPVGPQSPPGAGNPTYLGGPASVTADKLVLPQNKRRKSNNHQASAGSTPVPAPQSSLPQSSPSGAKTSSSPEVQRAAVPQMSFKCSFSNCASGQKGFATQAELEQHNIASHQPEELAIEDSVDFALESMRLALGLDENGKSKPQKEVIGAANMKPSSSAQSHAAVKQEVSTPMSRMGTQPGRSQAPQHAKASQETSNVKSPAPNGLVGTHGGKGKGPMGPTTSIKEATPPPFDPWAGSLISAEDITSAWSNLGDMQSSSFTKIQTGLTPSSTLSSGNDKSEKNSPRASDISENDAVKISIGLGNDYDKDNWLPSEWFEDTTLNGEIEGLSFGNENMLSDVDWDIFGDDADDAVMVDVGGPLTARGARDQEFLVSDEWLKVYDPEKLAKKRGR
ncbi:MAG: hypothetical protein Q9174_001548 [Haloplaca sp. 1 TL-2023]